MTTQMSSAPWPTVGIADLERDESIEIGRGKVISKKDIADIPGTFPVYSSAKKNDGKFGEYGHYMFDEELITWSVDGGGSLFHRPRHKFSITNVGGFVRILDPTRVFCRYLYFALSHLHSQAEFDWVRKAHPSVIRKVYLAIPLPPLEEQKRIVAVLDQAFAALDRARDHAEANLADAEGLFLNALRDVFSNHSTKFISDKAPNVRSAPTSSGQKRSKVSTQTGGRGATTRPIHGDYSLAVLASNSQARRGWIWSPLSALARLESGHTPSRKRPEYWGGDIGWIGIRDARDKHGTEIFSTNEQTNETGITNSSARILPKGTVCLSRTASVGYVVVMGKDMATSQDFVNWICGENIEPEFLKYLLMAQGNEIRRFASGSVHQTIYFPEVKAFHVCHPTRELQQKICDSLSAISNETRKLEIQYQRKLADISNLRQSLLQKAFSGHL